MIKGIARAESLKAKLSKSDYKQMLRSTEKEFSRNKDNSSEDSFFLISGKQMTEIIESAVIESCYVENLFKEIGITMPLEGQSLPDLKEVRKNRKQQNNRVDDS